MQLTQQQQSAFDDICRFIDGDGQVFILRGYAGTGKTTLVRHIIQYISSVNRAYKLMAPTGRAANVLTAKVSCADGGAAATTIHRGIYNFQEMKAKIDDEDIAKSSYKLYFPLRVSDTPEVCIIDEASMLGNNLSEGEMYSFGTNHLLDDVMTYVNLQHNGKLILVGDPAQLPPVGENVSKALDASFFKMLGLRVSESTLTEVLRQDANSTLLSNAIKVRDAYNMHKYNDLSFIKGDDITAIAPSSLASIYYDKYYKPQIGNSVMICYSNRAANTYNQQIRQLIWGVENAKMQVEDVMMVINNHYVGEINGKDIMNGEFVKILSVSNEETHHVPVYSPSKERVTMDITYVDASVLLADGKVWEGKVITEPVLSASEGNLSLMMCKALYIDFCMRNAKLKPNTEEFAQSLRNDPYYNALKVRYGYAVTCHKSQGGEWNDVFIDFEGVHVDRFGLRWIYTAITRAKQHIYAANLPQVSPIDKLGIAPINRVDKPISSYPSLISSVEDTIVSPFHTSQAAPYLRAKYAEVVAQLMHSDYRVTKVQSLQYLERYTISVPSGKSVIVDFYYNGKGVFRTPKTTDTALLSLLSAPAPIAENTPKPELSYVPSNGAMSYLYHLMQSVCRQSDVDIVGVTEFLENYHTTYYLRTSGQYAWIDFFINGKGFITYAAPCTTAENDTKLQSIIHILNHTD